MFEIELQEVVFAVMDFQSRKDATRGKLSSRLPGIRRGERPKYWCSETRLLYCSARVLYLWSQLFAASILAFFIKTKSRSQISRDSRLQCTPV